jgi:hypothetical protein
LRVFIKQGLLSQLFDRHDNTRIRIYPGSDCPDFSPT